MNINPIGLLILVAVVVAIGFFAGWRGGVVEHARDALRYRKLRGWMSSNVPEGWEQVEHLGAIAAWVDWDSFDAHLDSLGECRVGLMSPPTLSTQEQITRHVASLPPRAAGYVRREMAKKQGRQP